MNKLIMLIHLIQIHTWMRKRDVGTTHQKRKNNVLIAFQVISSNFSREKLVSRNTLPPQDWDKL